MKKNLCFAFLILTILSTTCGVVYADGSVKRINKKQLLKKGQTIKAPVKYECGKKYTQNAKKTTIIPQTNSKAGTTIGTTTYDLQTNNAIGNRVFVDKDGGIHATYTYSNTFDLGAPDRGTGYVYSADGGETWTDAPTSRLEADRNGWPNIVVTPSGRIIIVSHFAGSTNAFGGLSWMKKDPGGEWEHGQFPVGDDNDTWARMVISGSNIHLIAGRLEGSVCGISGGLAYFRSTDEGDTWETMPCMEGLDENNFRFIGGDAYAIDASGDNVAFVLGTYQATLFKSADNGETWTHTVINPLDNPLYDGDDGLPLDDDFVLTSDRSYAILVDHDGVAHVWFGRTIGSDTDGMGFGLFPDNAGIMYWNENMNSEPKVVGQTVKQDMDGDCEFFFDFNVSTTFVYRQMIVSMPSAGIDADGNLYLTYSAVTENALDANNNYRRDLFAVKSMDGGQTWEGPLNITNNPDEEAVYGSVARTVDGHLHVIYMSDPFAGNAVDGSSPQNENFVSNEIKYVKIPVEDIKAPDSDLNTCPQLATYSIPYAIQDCEVGIDRFSAFCIDYPDGDVNDKVVISGVDVSTPSEEAGPWMLSVMDNDGNESAETINDIDGNPIPVIVSEDSENPIIVGAPYEVEGGDIEDFYFDIDIVIFTSFDFFDTIDVIINTSYTDLGAVVVDDGDGFGCLATLTTTNSVDVSTLGVYEVTYNAVDNVGKEADPLVRVVRVISEDATPPTLFLSTLAGIDVMDGETLTVDLEQGGSWEGLDVFAIDNVDGDISNQVRIDGTVNVEVSDTYEVTYTATDQAGLSTSATVNVEVKDSQAPLLTLIGPATIILPCEAPFTEPGVTAFDNSDGDITASITIDGEVCNTWADTYTLTYRACDMAGNCATANRNIVVLAPCDINDCNTIGAPPTIDASDVATDCDNPEIPDSGFFTANDGEDGDLTSSVTVDASSVNLGISGPQTLTLSVTDADGNTTSVDVILDVTCAVGVEDVQLAQAISLYPNPTKDILNMAINLDKTQEVTINVYTLVGQVVGTYAKTVNGATVLPINLNHQAAGVYFVSVTTEEGSITRKVVVE